LTNYDWPGNVRQLRNEIERVVAYASEGLRVSPDDLSPEVANPRKSLGNGRRTEVARTMSAAASGRWESSAGRVKLKEATASLERQLIQEALARNRNNLSRTAVDLGLSRRGLRLKLAQLGIERAETT
jgi:two-component system response regulator HupR/HoxA